MQAYEGAFESSNCVLASRVESAPIGTVCGSAEPREWRIQLAVRPTRYSLRMSFCKVTRVPPDNAQHTFEKPETSCVLPCSQKYLSDHVEAGLNMVGNSPHCGARHGSNSYTERYASTSSVLSVISNARSAAQLRSWLWHTPCPAKSVPRSRNGPTATAGRSTAGSQLGCGCRFVCHGAAARKPAPHQTLHCMTCKTRRCCKLWPYRYALGWMDTDREGTMALCQSVHKGLPPWATHVVHF